MNENNIVIFFFKAKSRLTGLLEMMESKEETDSVVEHRHNSADDDRQDHRAKVFLTSTLMFSHQGMVPARCHQFDKNLTINSIMP